MKTAELLNCPTGQFYLERPGTPEKMPLRAWDAADEYLIEHLEAHHAGQPLNIINDGFGGLAIALHQRWQNDNAGLWITDSYCAWQALQHNAQLNQHISIESSVFPKLTHDTNDWHSPTSLWAMKIPKNTSLLQFQLEKLIQKAKTQPQTVVMAGMMKHLPKTLLNTLNALGEVVREPFKKKAMLLTLTLTAESTTASSNRYPKQHTFFNTQVLAHANVFGRDKLDQGTDLLLQSLGKQQFASGLNVADLCCGTGIIGLHFAKNNECASVDFYDESFMAVQCAQAGIELNNISPSPPEDNQKKVSFSRSAWDDGMKSSANDHYDLILCNPPFHEQHAVGDHIAWRLFHDAHRALKPGGRLIIVGNRHLGYHTKLKRIFGNANNLAANTKFVVLSSSKS